MILCLVKLPGKTVDNEPAHFMASAALKHVFVGEFHTTCFVDNGARYFGTSQIKCYYCHVI
jgi:hypothetical protein